MPRKPRIDVGGCFYHVLNRANARMKIFFTDYDFKMMEQVFREGKSRFGVKIIAYCLMPNHFHLLIYTEKDGDMQKFMQWTTLTHTQLWHKKNGTTGTGHLYQGRYKSYLIKDNNHLFMEMVYIERNPVRSKLVKQAIDWKFSSARTRMGYNNPLITPPPIDLPRSYLSLINDTN